MTTITTSDILLENATKYADKPALSSKDKAGIGKQQHGLSFLEKQWMLQSH